MSKTTFQKVIEELCSSFESFKRDGSDDRLVRMKDDRAEWLAGSAFMLACHSAVDDRLPDDWFYETARAIADGINDHDCEDADSAREALHEIADGHVDVYNSALTAWLSSHIYNVSIVDEACEELGCEDADTIKRIQVGQYHAISKIGESLIAQCEEEAESRDSDDE